MSKYAMASLAEGLSYELARYGVSVTHILAGFMDTGIYNVDNSGVRQPQSGRRPPSWLVMPVERAARQIVSATHRRKREQIVTRHAQAAIFLQRHFPRLVYFSISQAVRRAAKAPTRMTV
jgi:short-subunit dehydrogenase